MDQSNTELVEKLGRLIRLLHKHHLHAFAERGPMADPTRGQGRIIALLKIRDSISTKEMSFLLDISISSLNELLSKMEKAGYVSREASEEDKRVMLVKLTEKGKAEQQQDRTPCQIFDCLSEAEQKTLGSYLDRIIASMEESMGEEMDDDEREWWIHEAQERMGDKMFERMAAAHYHAFMKRGFDRRHDFERFHDRWHEDPKRDK